MDPTTGAYQHISMGLRELGKYAELVEFVPAPPSRTRSVTPVSSSDKKEAGLRASGAWGALRDLRDFVRNCRSGWRIAKAVKRSGCEAAYVRVEYLQPVSLFLRRMGINVFLEANGLQFESRKRRFKSWLSCLYEPFERYIYSKAEHVFFVGSYGDYWKLPDTNWTNVKNGIEPELFSIDLPPKPQTPPLKLCLLARLVGHHQVDVLIDANKSLDPQIAKQVELHLIGSGFEVLIAECEDAVVG